MIICCVIITGIHQHYTIPLLQLNFYCTYITFWSLEEINKIPADRVLWRQIYCWRHEGHKKVTMFSSKTFFSLSVPFILTEFQWPLQASNNCWILRNVLSELHKKTHAQWARLQTKTCQLLWFLTVLNLWKRWHRLPRNINSEWSEGLRGGVVGIKVSTVYFDKTDMNTSLESDGITTRDVHD